MANEVLRHAHRSYSGEGRKGEDVDYGKYNRGTCENEEGKEVRKSRRNIPLCPKAGTPRKWKGQSRCCTR